MALTPWVMDRETNRLMPLLARFISLTPPFVTVLQTIAYDNSLTMTATLYYNLFESESVLQINEWSKKNLILNSDSASQTNTNTVQTDSENCFIGRGEVGNCHKSTVQ